MNHATNGDRALPSYTQVQNSQEFTDLRRTFRRFVFPMTAFFVVWYFLYVILAAYAPGFMSTKLVGNINVGLVMGLLQFVTTFAITVIYVRWADRVFDPAADRIRHRMERAHDTDVPTDGRHGAHTTGELGGRLDEGGVR